MADQYFEKQKEQDCTIHSLNNAMGRIVVTKDEVVSYIESLVKDYRKKMGGEVSRHDEQTFRKRFSNKRTSFFTAEIVWRTAQSLGRIGPQTPIPGFGGNFAKVHRLPNPLPRHMVLLGVEPEGGHHAVAVRDGTIYDSLRPKPVPLTDENLARSLKHVFAAFAILEQGEKKTHYARHGPSYIRE